ncbi:MAG: hypothetical protein PHH06_00880 [Candidatus Gracilibacteria bacterium]|nr:hypothetical protein [Candidatus Gracilibacteria bacterium]
MAEAFKANEAQNFETQENSGDILSDNEKLEQALQEKKDYIYSMEWDDSLGDKQQAKKQFELYTDGLNDTQKQNFIDVISKPTAFDLQIFIYDNGYPINEETFSLFENKFGKITENRANKKEDIAVEKEDIAVEKEDIAVEKEDIINIYKSNFTQEVINQFDGNFKDNLQILFDGKAAAEEIDKSANFIDNELLNNQETLTKLLTLIQKESPEKYESFKNYLISRDSGFEAKIARFEFENHELFQGISPIKSARNDALLQNTTKYNGKYLADLGKHIGLRIDPNKEPPETIITNGNYDLKTESGVGVFYKPTLEYETKARELNKKIEGLNTQMNDVVTKGNQVTSIDLLSDNSGLDKLESIFVGDIEVGQLIDQFKTDNFDFETGNLSLTPENTSTLKDKIKGVLNQRYTTLNQTYQKLIEEFKSIEKKYLQELDSKKKEYFDNIGKKQKETLRFLQASGLNNIPQNILNQLITEYQSGLLNIPGLNLNRQNIDLENARFGESTTEVGKNGLSDQAKRNLVAFMEKLIYGEVTPKNSIFASIDATKDFSLLNTTVIKALEDNGVKSHLSFNINNMRENLRREVK